MYESYYKLSNDPFRLLPDPGVCFPHRSSNRAWAYLRYALKRGEGIVVVTGPPGSGKTTLSERLLGEVNPAKVVAVRIVAAELSATDLLRKLAYEMGLQVEGKDRSMLSLMIERHLLGVERSHRSVLVVVDEAQTLSHHALEALRLLTDLQVQGKPVMQLVLFGQDELEGVMGAPGMEQFQQRVIAGCRLEPMDLVETKGYIEYRLSVANWRGDPSVNGPAVLAIYRYSHGIPRHVNKICSRLFLHASGEERHALTDRDVRVVVGDLRNELLAPVDDDPLAGESLSGGVFDSVYELSLVPAREEPATHVPAARVTSPAVRPMMDQGYATADSRPMSGQPATFVRYSRGRPARRRLRSLIRTLPLRLRDALVAAWAWLADALRHLPDRRLVAARLRDSTAAMRATLKTGFEKRWPVLRTKLMLTMQDLRTQRIGVAVPVMVLGAAAALIGIALLPFGGGSTAPTTRATDLATEADTAYRYAGNVLDGSQYVNSSAGKQPHGLPASTGGGEHDLSAGFNLADAGITQGEAVSAMAAAPDIRDGVVPIADGVAVGLVDELSRADSTLNIWAVARNASNEASGKDGVLWSREAEDTAHADASVATNDASAEPDKVTSGTVSTAAAAEPATSDDAGVANEKQIAMMFIRETDAQLDYVRFLPATGAGKVAETPPPAVMESGVSYAAELELVDGAEPDATGASTLPERPVVIAQVEDTSSTTAAPDVIAHADDSLSTSSMSDAATVAADASPTAAPAAPEDVADAPAPAAPSVPSKVTQLLAAAEEAYDADRLLLPEKRSAYGYLQAVLAVDADNAAAHAGITRIVDRYADLAREAIAQENFDRAERFVDRGLRVNSRSTLLRALQQEVDVARAEAEAVAMAEAEMARLAAQPEVVEPVVETPKPKLSNFQRLMNFASGL